MPSKVHCFQVATAIAIVLTVISSHLDAAQIQLSWTAPTTNADNTPLTDLAGYRLYYGQTSGNYASSLDVGNQTSYILSGLTAGQRYYFAVTAYDTSGNESVPSQEVSALAPVDPDTTPPTLGVVSVPDGSSGVDPNTSITISFSEATDPTTITTSTVWLRDAAGNVVTASVTYDAATYTITLPPTSALAPGTTYTMTIEGGADGVRDMAGNPLAAISPGPSPPTPADMPAQPLECRRHACGGFMVRRQRR